MIDFEVVWRSENQCSIITKRDTLYTIRGKDGEFTLHNTKSDVLHHRYKTPRHAINAAIKQIIGG